MKKFILCILIIIFRIINFQVYGASPTGRICILGNKSYTTPNYGKNLFLIGIVILFLVLKILKKLNKKYIFNDETLAG